MFFLSYVSFTLLTISFFFFFFFVLFIQIRRSITEDHLLHNKLRASFHFFFSFFFFFFFSRFHFCFSFYLLFWHYFRLNVDIWCSVTKRVLYSFFQFFFFLFFSRRARLEKNHLSIIWLINLMYGNSLAISSIVSNFFPPPLSDKHRDE